MTRARERGNRGRMRRDRILAVALAAVFGLDPRASLAQPPHRSGGAAQVLRNAYGQPDLEGLWSNGSLTRLQRRPGAPLTFATRAEEDAFEQAALKRWAAQTSDGI